MTALRRSPSLGPITPLYSLSSLSPTPNTASFSSPRFTPSLSPDSDSFGSPGSEADGDGGAGFQSAMSTLETEPSLYSYRSSRDGVFMKMESHGRMFNSQTDLYVLPADEEEHARLDTQHMMLRAALHNSLYPAKDRIREILAPIPDRPRAILDVGTGAGVWAIEMAQEFPEAEVVGMDLVLPTRIPPSNCRFEADDVTLGMSHYQSHFDVVHARAVSHGVPDFEAFIDDIADTVREGGMLIIVDGRLQLFREDQSPMDPEETAVQKVLFASYNALKSRGSGVDTGLTFRKQMQESPKLKNHGSFEAYIPIGGWYDGDGTEEEKRRWRYMGELLRHNCKGFAKSLRPLLLSDGYFPDCVDRMMADADKELDQNNIRGWAVWFYAWAERESYDIAPLNPKPDPADAADSLVEELAGTTLEEEELETRSLILPPEDIERSTDVVMQWLEDAVVHGVPEDLEMIAEQSDMEHSDHELEGPGE